ncbi:uncharacterized protein BCR38DRAFT_485570 [Pseudomassariella vexata]|uniref:DUF4604 domain-containing protein n=1 Tax=Pseudomassariella vexata TaxID=1141098 RepID=A0A1Y2DYT2_9PEZI|nr:uncharacterized protein BCR38DRAFT_485570 [Pseudomassariella vexata]ORY64413.1 hypothetical protein BCR38DRAFT_485570 [Pseudomassariella vexata]
MAPTSTLSFKGTNPAPNYLVSMNSIQQLLNAKSSFADPSLSSAAPKPSSSNIQTPSKSTPLDPGAQAQTRARARADEEKDLEQYAGLDANMGLGMVTGKTSAQAIKDRDTKILRGRLLGKGRKVGDGESGKRRREESSDEDEGRSGIVRGKTGAKRRVIIQAEDGGHREGPRDEPAAEPEADKAAAADVVMEEAPEADKQPNTDIDANGDGSTQEDAQEVETRSKDGEATRPDEDAKAKKKRKKKNKKKKSKTAVVEAE